ncbi:trimethylamine methyltransferase family protein, partial [Desulfobacterales bacterium HSG17]|nr:trimethylamine methyltransferase family protein [Desulfobacterales bacterium HSG17]
MFAQAQFLSQEDQQIIHNESIRILKEVGVLFHSKKALDILKKNGAKVDYADNIAKIPEEMVNAALKTAPKSFVCGARVSDNDFALPSTYSGYVLDNGGIFTRDFKTGERRKATAQDHYEFLRVFDEMKLASMVWATSVQEPEPYNLVRKILTSYMHSSLHIQHELSHPKEVPYMIEGLEAILGSSDAVKERKLFSVIYCTLAPLVHEGHMCDAYLDLIEYEQPVCIFPMACAGSTGPASLYSNIALGNAEALSSLVLFQMAKPGCPLIFGDASGSTNFSSGGFLEGSPEMVLQSAARGEMARFYGLPNEQAGCLADAKEHGPQAIMEKMVTTLPLVMNGVDLVQGPGALETSNMMSLEQIVVDDEIACVCKRIRDGIDMSEAKNYFEDIKDVKPGGHFLTQMNTVKACRSDEFLAPSLCDRDTYEKWDELGRPDMYDKARERVEEILASPQKNPLPDDVIGKLEEIMRRADEKIN